METHVGAIYVQGSTDYSLCYQNCPNWPRSHTSLKNKPLVPSENNIGWHTEFVRMLWKSEYSVLNCNSGKNEQPPEVAGSIRLRSLLSSIWIYLQPTIRSYGVRLGERSVLFSPDTHSTCVGLKKCRIWNTFWITYLTINELIRQAGC